MNTYIAYSVITQRLNILIVVLTTIFIIIYSYVFTSNFVSHGFLWNVAFLKPKHKMSKTSHYSILKVSYKQLLYLFTFPTRNLVLLFRANILFAKRYILLLESYMFLLTRYIFLLWSYLFLSTRCFFLTKTYPFLSKGYILPTKTYHFLSKGYILPTKTYHFLSKPNIFLLTSDFFLSFTYIILLHMDMFLSTCVSILKPNNNINLYNIPNSLTQPYNYQSKITIL